MDLLNIDLDNIVMIELFHYLVQVTSPDPPLRHECARTGEDLEGKDQRKYQRGRCDWNWSNSQAIIRNLTKHQSPDRHTPRYCSLLQDLLLVTYAISVVAPGAA